MTGVQEGPEDPGGPEAVARRLKRAPGGPEGPGGSTGSRITFILPTGGSALRPTFLLYCKVRGWGVADGEGQ